MMTEPPLSESTDVVPVEALKPIDQELCKEAAKAARTAYAPYSNFSVGAAVRTVGGATYVAPT